MRCLVPRGLNVPLSLMAAGLSEGRTDEGAQGGGGRARGRRRWTAAVTALTPEAMRRAEDRRVPDRYGNGGCVCQRGSGSVCGPEGSERCCVRTRLRARATRSEGTC